MPGAGNGGARMSYTGQMWLASLGLYHYKARAYNPATGRFMQPDPILYGDGMNMYSYVANDPVNARDPSGLRTCFTTTSYFSTTVWSPFGNYGTTTLRSIDTQNCYDDAGAGNFGGGGEGGTGGRGGRNNKGKGKNDDGEQTCSVGRASQSFEGVGVRPLVGAATTKTATQSSLKLLSRFLAPLAIHQLLSPGVRNDPHVPIFRAVSSAELVDIFSTTPASFRPGPGSLESKQFFLSLTGAQQFASSSLISDASAIVSTRVRPSTLQQGDPLSLPSGESAGVGGVSFPPAALPALNRDAAQTGIQIVQACGND